MNKSCRWMNLMATLCVMAIGACGMVTSANASGLTNIFFLHHSVGSGLIEGGAMRSVIAACDSATGKNFGLWDHGYNADGLRDANGTELGINYAVPGDNTEPSGYACLWTSAQADATACRNQIMANHQVIAFKSCYTASSITDANMLEEYKQDYLAMRAFFEQHPEKLFVVLTPPPRHRLDTTATQAAFSRQFADWLKSSAFLGGRTNVVCLDLFDALAGSDNFLKYAYEGSHTGTDSHPNNLANQTIGPLLAGALVVLADAYQSGSTPVAPTATVLANGSSGSLTLPSSDTLAVSIALNAGDYAGLNAGWWVLAQTPAGWYYYDYANRQGWQAGVGLTLQAPLNNLADCEIIAISGLPAGIYVFYFGVDTVPDGQISFNALYYSGVIVNIQ